MTESAAHALPLLRELLLFCAIAGVLIPLVRRLHFSQVLAFLLAGVAVGPFGLGALADESTALGLLSITDLEGARAIAEFGVVFLLFTLGLELSTDQLWAMRRWVFGLGNVQIVATAVLIGALAYFFGNDAAASMVLGLALALSSTAIVMQLLHERHEIGSPVGRASFAVLLMQDLMVVPLLVLVDQFGDGEGASLHVALPLAILKAAVAITLIALVGKRLAQPLFQRVSASHQPDAFMALTLLVTLGTAALTWLAGLSFALGAFLAGLLLAETAYRHQVRIAIEPFRGLFIGLFFMAVGMGLDLSELAAEPLWIPLSVCGLFAIKIPVTALAMRAFGVPAREALEAGFLLGQGGEFAFIVIGIALSKGLMTPAIGQFMLLVVGFSMLAAPGMARLGRLLRSRGAPGAPATATLPVGLSRHVVIAGYGRVGQLLGEVLDREGIPFVALDRDVARVAALHAQGAPVYFGDAEHPDLLPGVIAQEALAVVITLDDPGAAAAIASRLREHLPGLPVLARARDEAHAATLRAFGAQRVIPETLETALQMSGHVLEALGYSTEAAQQLVQVMREARLADAEGAPRPG